MRLPNLNWPANLYMDVMTSLADIEMPECTGRDYDEIYHDGGGEPRGACCRAPHARNLAEPSVDNAEFESFTISGISTRSSMTASQP